MNARTHIIRGLGLGLALAALLAGQAAAKINLKKVEVAEEGGRLVLRVAADGKAQVSLTTGHEKWILEAKDSVLAMRKPVEVRRGAVARVRLGQHGKDARLVIDLNSDLSKAPVVADAKGFTLDLGPAGPALGAAPAAEGLEGAAVVPVASAGLTYRVVDISLEEEEGLSRVVITADGPVRFKASQKDDGKRVVIKVLNGSLAWKPSGRLANKAVESVKATATSDNGSPAAAVDIELVQPLHYSIHRDQNQVVVSVDTPLADDGAAPKKGSLDATFSLDVQNADMVGTLNSLCNQAGFETFVGPSMLQANKTVTLRVDNLPLAKILSNILGPVDMSYDLQGNIVYFGTKDEIQKQKSLIPKITRSYMPRSMERDVLTKRINQELTALDPVLAQSVTVDKDVDPSSEGVTIIATREDMAKVMAVVARIDAVREEDGADEEAEATGGRRKTQVFRLRYTRPADLLDAVTTIMTPPGGAVAGDIKTDTRTRSFIITTTPKYLKRVRQLLDRLDINISQVSIEARIIEVNATDTNQLGINWTAKKTGTNPDPSVSVAVGQAAASSWGSVTVGTLQNMMQINANLQALINQQKANLLSSPRITTQDDVAANIETKDVVFYLDSTTVTGTTTSTSNTWRQIDVPITLNVTPYINTENNDVRMKVQFSITAVSGEAAAGSPPPLSTQSANTYVVVRNGETAAIGGLLRDRMSMTENKVPVLGDIPLLGWAFKSKSMTTEKKELVILLTPTISED